MNDQEFRRLLDRQIELLDAVRDQGVLAALRYREEMERGARAVIAECYRRLDAQSSRRANDSARQADD